MSTAILLISSADQRGITANVTNFIYQHNGNIVHADQHIDDQTNTFFMRVEWSLDGFDLPQDKIKESFKPTADRFNMSWQLFFSQERLRVAIFASKHLHCLKDILIRHEAGQFECDIPLIISNHFEAKKMAHDHHASFAEFPITKDNKAAQEDKQLNLLKEHRIDCILLARYHQILTPQFIEVYPYKIINIHHSFLPAFVGKNPYRQAYEKGVKIIGATSHYVTKELDEGPIIEQDTVRVSHRDTWEDLVRKGEDLEKMVLSRAFRLYLERKILCYNNKTVVFD